jgi:nitrogen regulatory protein PII 1
MVGWRMSMKLIRAIVRPDSVREIVDELDAVGLGAMTKINAFGQGKQKCSAEVPVEWDESLTAHEASRKVMLMIAVEDDEVSTVTNIIINVARTGNVGDGKIFISGIDQAYTIGTKMPV